MGSPPRVETHQLLLRAPEAGDVDPLFEIQGDARAMQYTFCASDPAATARHLRRHAKRFEADGFAPWIAVSRAEGRVVGWGGLFCDPDAPEWGPEVGYFIHPDAWGRGLAGEIVQAALELAFERVGLEAVGAFARPENAASIRVLERAGFRFVRYVAELERNQYRVSAPSPDPGVAS